MIMWPLSPLSLARRGPVRLLISIKLKETLFTVIDKADLNTFYI
jgi:hypothetical protein